MNMNGKTARLPFKPMVYNNVDHKLTSLFIRDLKKRTARDDSFQSEGRWDSKQKIKYITSLVTGMAPSKIVIANIKKCLENAETDSYDFDYFNDWYKQKYENISIDGNNRTVAIQEYMDGKVSIKHGDYILPSGKVIQIDSTNDTWSKHPNDFRDYINDNVTVTVSEYSNATRADLTLLFLNINDGMSLNQQEMRNPILVPFADWVRCITKETYSSMLIKVFPTKKQLVRRTIDDFIVGMAIYVTYGTSVTIQAGEKNKAYEDDSTVGSQTKRAGKIITDFANFVKRNAGNELKESSTLFNLFMTYYHIIDGNYVIKNESQFYKWFISKENKRIGDTKTIMTTKGGESRTYSSCNGTMSSPELTARFQYIIKDLNDVIGEFVFLKDENRLFNKTERYQLWEKQNGKCPETGKEIPESEINDDSKWAADHIIPFSRGGKTIMENGQLIDKTANLKKSNKLEVVG